MNTLLTFWQVNQLSLNLDRLVLFNMHIYDEFHVPDVFIVLLYMWRQNSQGYWFNKSNLINYWWAVSQIYTRQLYEHMLCIIFAWLACCSCLSHKFWIGLVYNNTTLVDCLLLVCVTILIVLSITHVAPIKAKLWLEESLYRKCGTNAFQKMGAGF